MNGVVYDTRQVPFMFLSVFLASVTLHKTNFFREDNQSNIFRLNYAQLICETVRSEKKIVQSHSQFNNDCDNIVLALEGFRVS